MRASGPAADDHKVRFRLYSVVISSLQDGVPPSGGV